MVLGHCCDTIYKNIQLIEVTVRTVGYTSWTDRILFAATILRIISLVSYKRKGEKESESEREREREREAHAGG